MSSSHNTVQCAFSSITSVNFYENVYVDIFLSPLVSNKVNSATNNRVIGPNLRVHKFL